MRDICGKQEIQRLRLQERTSISIELVTPGHGFFHFVDFPCGSLLVQWWLDCAYSSGGFTPFLFARFIQVDMSYVHVCSHQMFITRPIGVLTGTLFFSLVTYLCIMHESAQIKLLGHRRLRQIKAAPSGPATSPTPFRLTIIHFNDVYEMAGVLEAGWRKNRMLIPASQVPIGIF